MCFIIIREIRWVNSLIYIFFKVFRHGIMVLIKTYDENTKIIEETKDYVTIGGDGKAVA